MIEYELVRGQSEDLRRRAEHHRLVREAEAVRGPGALRRAAAALAAVTAPRAARLREC